MRFKIAATIIGSVFLTFLGLMFWSLGLWPFCAIWAVSIVIGWAASETTKGVMKWVDKTQEDAKRLDYEQQLREWNKKNGR